MFLVQCKVDSNVKGDNVKIVLDNLDDVDGGWSLSQHASGYRVHPWAGSLVYDRCR